MILTTLCLKRGGLGRSHCVGGVAGLRLQGRVFALPSRIEEMYDPSQPGVRCRFKDLENPCLTCLTEVDVFIRHSETF